MAAGVVASQTAGGGVAATSSVSAGTTIREASGWFAVGGMSGAGACGGSADFMDSTGTGIDPVSARGTSGPFAAAGVVGSDITTGNWISIACSAAATETSGAAVVDIRAGLSVSDSKPPAGTVTGAPIGGIGTGL